MDILSEYLKICQNDSTNVLKASDEELAEWDKNLTDEDKEAIDGYYSQLTDSVLNPHKAYERIKEEFPDIKEDEFKTVKREDVRMVVIHVYCPECGREIISKSPVMYNPYTKERICRDECICGKKMNLEHAYPRVAYINENNEEVNARCE